MSETRGALRVFLGAAPGVGKTYEMLEEARAKAAEGVDVVAAVIHTHGRAATEAMTQGLEHIPERTVTYRGTQLHELDVDAVIARAPQIALVDEMAHSNAPGSRNAKRWIDIEEIRSAGIEVWTTINIQHLESLNDVVAQITGVIQHETVPDEAVRAADEIELVDIAPQALRQRLADGKVYRTRQAEGALANYFRAGNLTALRELALLWLADQVDDALARYRDSHAITDTWETRERVVVAVTGGPESATLIRRARRIASRSSAEVVVVHVARGDGLLDPERRTLTGLEELAKGFGARMHTVVGEDIPTALLEFARGVNATQLVLGTSRRSRWQRFLREGVGSAVVRNSGKIDVHMVTHGQDRHQRRLDIRGTRLHRPLSWVLAVVVPLVAAALIYLVDRWMNVSSESAVFFIAILAVSLLGGIGPAVASAVLSGLLLNYLFTSPRYTLTVSDPNNALTIVVMIVVAIAVAALVDSVSRRRAEAVRATREAELLATFAGAVLGGAGLDALLERVREAYDQTSVSLVRTTGQGTIGVDGTHSDRVVEAGVGEQPPTEPSAADTVIAVPGNDDVELLLSGRRIGAEDRRVLTAVALQAAGVLERRRLAAEASAAVALAETDRLRRALLTAVSHDLRTPLAAIKAAASSLRSTDVSFSPEDTEELLATIDESADDLTSLVGNLLDSSRLAAGVITPSFSYVYLSEVTARVTASIAAHAPHAVERLVIDVDDERVWADAGLLERVLVNVVDNALRHGDGSHAEGGGSDKVEIIASSLGYPHAPGVGGVADDADDRYRCRIDVIDHGPGIRDSLREHAFDAFTTEGDRNSSSGVGLGLSVARGFTEAMGGRIDLVDTLGGGLTVRIEIGKEEPVDD